MAPDGSAGSAIGNTKQSRIIASLNWFFTLNNYSDKDIEDILLIFNNILLVKDYVFQKEKGANLTPHLQGYVKFVKKVRPIENFDNKKIHWEKVRDISAAIAYCSKEDSYDGERWTNIKLKEPIKILNDDQLFKWQLNIIELIKKSPDDRIINWFWESYGCIGKTQFCKYLVVKYNACIMGGKASDCKHGIIKFNETTGDFPKIVIFDIPRCNKDFISYDAIESIKNGLFFSGKYEGCQIIFNSPHIICFSNEPPEIEKLSLDRWNIIKL